MIKRGIAFKKVSLGKILEYEGGEGGRSLNRIILRKNTDPINASCIIIRFLNDSLGFSLSNRNTGINVPTAPETNEANVQIEVTATLFYTNHQLDATFAGVFNTNTLPAEQTTLPTIIHQKL